jgi:hypothetical protein
MPPRSGKHGGIGMSNASSVIKIGRPSARALPPSSSDHGGTIRQRLEAMNASLVMDRACAHLFLCSQQHGLDAILFVELARNASCVRMRGVCRSITGSMCCPWQKQL